MNAPLIKTSAEQKLEWLESLKRPLTDGESDELRRALHATYCHMRKSNALAAYEREEAELTRRLEVEAQLPSRLS
jgi:hypothetical protein